MQGSTAGGQHYSVPVAAGVGADPINALQNLSKQPVPAAMAQQGDCQIIVTIHFIALVPNLEANYPSWVMRTFDFGEFALFCSVSVLITTYFIEHKLVCEKQAQP